MTSHDTDAAPSCRRGAMALRLALLGGAAAAHPAAAQLQAQQAQMQVQQPRAPAAGAPFAAATVEDRLEIGNIENDSVAPGNAGYRAYLFRPTGPVQLDVESKVIDATIEVYEPGAKLPLKSDDDGGGGLNPRLVLPRGSYRLPLIVVVRDAQHKGGRFVLRAARLDDTAAKAAVRLTIGQPAQGATLDQNSLRRAGLDHPYAEFTFGAHAGQRVQIDVESDQFNPTIELRYNGQRIGGDEDSGAGTNSRMLRYLTGDGDYTLSVLSLSDKLGAYSVRVTEAPPARTMPDILRIEPGQTVNGVFTVESPVLGDLAYAYYLLRGAAGQTMRITLAQAAEKDGGQTPLVYLDVGATTPAGFASVNAAVSARDGDARLDVRFQEAGELMIRARGEIDWRGPYTLRAEPVANPS